MKKTKIIATVWPTTDTIEKLENLYKAWANIIRLNFKDENCINYSVSGLLVLSSSRSAAGWWGYDMEPFRCSRIKTGILEKVLSWRYPYVPWIFHEWQPPWKDGEVLWGGWYQSSDPQSGRQGNFQGTVLFQKRAAGCGRCIQGEGQRQYLELLFL